MNFKKIMSAAMCSIVSLVSIAGISGSYKADAYYAGQELTYRVYEYGILNNVSSYMSISTNSGGYTYGGTIKFSTIPSIGYFNSNYDESTKDLTITYIGPPNITNAGYFTVTTWYTPTNAIFNVNYYNTQSNITDKTILIGDFNQDGFVNTLDANDLASYLAGGSITVTPDMLLAGDANNDGKTDARDCAAIARFAAGNVLRIGE